MSLIDDNDRKAYSQQVADQKTREEKGCEALKQALPQIAQAMVEAAKKAYRDQGRIVSCHIGMSLDCTVGDIPYMERQRIVHPALVAAFELPESAFHVKVESDSESPQWVTVQAVFTPPLT